MRWLHHPHFFAFLFTVAMMADAAARPDRVPPPAPAPGPGAAERGRFLGPHPIVARLGGGYCYIEAPHIHAYVPDRPVLYKQIGEDYLFTGDPVPFGYEGPRTVFYGHHPVPVHIDGPFAAPPVFCLLKGPHFHPYEAPQAPEYQVRDNVVFYMGPLAPEVVRVRPQIERGLDAEYRPFVAMRPQVTVAPPPQWPGEVWVVPAPAPVVQVQAPAPPRVHVVTPPAPGVHIVAPSPPSVHIAVPAPPRVHVTVPAPPAVIVAPPGPPAVIVAPGWGHPGKHKGWYKGKKHGH